MGSNTGQTFYFGPIDHRDVAVVTGDGSIGIGSHLPTANLDVLDLAELDSVNVSVALTTVDIDVTGHAEFDDVNVSTALTAKNIDVTGKLTGSIDINDLYVIGVSTFTKQVGIGSTTILGTEQTGHLRVVGFSTFWKVGIDTHLDVTGIATAQFGDIILGGDSTNSDKIRSNSGKIVSDDKLEIKSTTDSSENDGAIHTDGGISGKNLYIKEDSLLGKRVDVVFTPLYTFTAGQGILTATTSDVTDVQIGDYLQSRYDSDGPTLGSLLILPNTKVTSVTAIANNRTEIGISNPVAVDDNDQLEITILDVNGSSSHDLTIHSFVDSHIRPDSNNTYDLGTESLKWRDVHVSGMVTATTFYGAFSGTVTNAENVQVGHHPTNDGVYFLTLVPDNNNENSRQPEQLFNAGSLSWNTQSSQLTTGNLYVSNDTTFGNNVSNDDITLNASIKSSILPKTTGDYDIGSDSKRWATIYATDLNVSSGSLTAVNYSIGDLDVTGITTTVNLNVTGITTLGSDASDTLTINAKVDSNILPTGSSVAQVEDLTVNTTQSDFLTEM